MRSPLKRGAGLLAWDRGDTRIAYVVSNVMLKDNIINVVNFGLFIKKYNSLWEYCIM